MSQPRSHPPSAAPGAIAVAWYSPQHWAEMKRISSDADVFHATYEAWVDDLVRLAQSLNQEGRVIRVVSVTPEAFASWASECHLPLNSASRARFVAERADHGLDEPFPLFAVPPPSTGTPSAP